MVSVESAAPSGKKRELRVTACTKVPVQNVSELVARFGKQVGRVNKQASEYGQSLGIRFFGGL